MATTPPDDDTRPDPDDEDPGEVVQELRAKLQERDREVEELRAELANRDEQRRVAGHLALAGGSFAARIVAGRELAKAVKRWLGAKTAADPMPIDETADVAAAIVRRWLRVGLWHVVLASGGVVTAGILIWQGLLIRGQIEQQQAQNELIRSQLEQQTKDNLNVRRAQLLDRIHSKAPGWRGDLVTFVEVERGRNVRPDLSGADLSSADLPEIDLSGVDLSRTNLRGANLYRAKLSGTVLIGASLYRAKLSGANLHQAILIDADLRGADLNGADLNGADVHRADLRRADLIEADLIEANLIEANLHRADLSRALLSRADLSKAKLGQTNLHGADLRGAKNLTPEQLLAGACGDEDSKLPAGLAIDETCRYESRGMELPWVLVPLEQNTTSDDEPPLKPDEQPTSLTKRPLKSATPTFPDYQERYGQQR